VTEFPLQSRDRQQAFARGLGLGADVVGRRFVREATPSSPETTFDIVGLRGIPSTTGLRKSLRQSHFLSTAQNAEPAPLQILIRSDAPLVDLTSRVKKLSL